METMESPVFFDIFNNPRYSTKKELRPPGSQPRLKPPKVCKRRTTRSSTAINPPLFFFKEKTHVSCYYDSNDPLPYLDQCYEMFEKIGEGSFGQVFKVKDRETNEYYAVKIIRTFLREQYETPVMIKEVRNYECVPPHENIVRLVNAWEQDDFVYILMELGYTSLAKYVDNNPEFAELQLWNILLDMLLALKNLHDKSLVHLDVKLENIIINSCGICKLADFGLLMNLRDKVGLQHATEGDAKYVAVELMNGKYSKAADVFSLGISILELASNLELPSHGQLWHNLRNGLFPDEVYKYVPKELVNIIRRMMTRDYRKRPSVKTLLKHPRLKSLLKQRKHAESEGIQVEGRITPSVSSDEVGIPATPPNNGCLPNNNLFITPPSGYSVPDFTRLNSLSAKSRSSEACSRKLSFGRQSKIVESEICTDSLDSRNNSFSSAKKLNFLNDL